MSNTYGVTPAGFVLKPTTQIISDIEDQLLTNLDPALDTSATAPIGQINGIVGAAIGETWELGQAAYNAFNPDDVEGQAQDNIGQIRGSKRLTAKASSVFCNCVLTAAGATSGVYPAGSLVANVAGNPAAQFSNGQDVPVPTDGTYSALFTSLDLGPIAASSGTLTVITAPVTGWSSVTNPSDATLGTLLEADEDYRLRQEEELAAGGSCTVDADTTAILASDANIISVQTLENIGDFFDPSTGMPGHSFQAIVWDGPGALANPANIGLAVWNNKPSGSQTFGTTSVQIVDSLGFLRTVFFSRPSQLQVWLSFTITLASGAVLSTVAAAIKTAAVNLANGRDPNGVTLAAGTPGILAPGGTVEALVYRSLARFEVPGVIGCQGLALDFHASPTATADLSTGSTQIAVLDSSRILVNGV